MFREHSFEVGYISKPHGLKGEVILVLNNDDPENYKELESVFLEIEGKLVPFFIETYRSRNFESAIVKFEDFTSEKSINLLTGSKVFIDNKFKLPDEDTLYIENLVGYQLIDQHKNALGKILDYMENNSNDLFVLEINGEEVYIPVQDDLIIEIDQSAKRIKMLIPEGLIGINE